MPTDKCCVHCGANCTDDHRGAQTFPQPYHTNEAGAYWTPGCCPLCLMDDRIADAVGKINAERERIVDRFPRSSYPISVGAYVEALDFAVEALT